MKCLADGDSWFDYPKILMTGGGLADHLQAVTGLQIINIAHAGDSSEETMGLKKVSRLRQLLPGTDILFWSSGGDDVAGDQSRIWWNTRTEADGDVTEAINTPRFKPMLDLIEADYEDLFELRNEMAPNCLIVGHCYDFPPATMMGRGIANIIGPWLAPGLADRGWVNPNEQALIVAAALRPFRERIMAFFARQSRCVFVDTQGTCDQADWQNELHLRDSGWRKIAQKINAAMLPWLDAIKQGAITAS